jgi:multidrug efflux pump subunit AcrB
MAAYILKPIITQEKEGGTMRWYMGAVAWCVRHRWITSIAALAFFIGSLALVQYLPKGFIPPDDVAQSQIALELPPGATYADTLAVATAARELVKTHPHIKQVYTAVGGGTGTTDPFAAGGAAEVRKATLSLTLTHRRDRTMTKQVIEGELRTRLEALPGARVSVGLGGSGEKYILVLSGDDGKTLLEAAHAVERDLRTIKGIGNIASTASLIRPEIAIRPDFAKAAELGVSTTAIADTIRVATSGDYDQNLAKLNLSQRQVPIVVKLPAALRQDFDAIKRLKVPSATGSVALENVADVRMDSGPSQIDRYDRLRNINFEIELNGRELGDITEAVGGLPAIKNLPPGVTQTALGDAEVMEELFASFGLAMLTGIICIYVVLVLLFKGFAQPVTIMAALPLSIGGAFILLLAARSSLSMPSMIGLIMLMGVATKNSILLVEYAIVARRDHGMSRYDAIMDACHKRARPIVMTTLAMGAGMLPIALGWGVDPSFRSPMAIAVIGGLITSTFLSLLVIPVVFTIVDDVVLWFGRRVGKKDAVRVTPAAAE